MALLGSVLMLAGTAFSVLAAWGILDFPSPIARMHAATKSASLGLALLAVGAGVAAGSWPLIGMGTLVGVFMFVTAPIAGHMIGRAAYLAGQAVRPRPRRPGVGRCAAVADRATGPQGIGVRSGGWRWWRCG